jgi:phosphoribosylanthranilate isomerase
MSASPRVKICGVTRLDDARLAAELGAWAVGLTFYPRSPRRCTLEEAGRITGALRRQTEVCGVFYDAPLDEVIATADGIGLTLVQLHGHEGPAYCDEVARRTGARIVKAARVATRADVQALDAFRRVGFHLLDAHVRDLPGGTGETFDWELVRARRSRVPLILSGGLTSDNVGGAIEAVRPWAVDVASGVEEQPGVKDPARLEAFFAAVGASAPDGEAVAS